MNFEAFGAKFFLETQSQLTSVGGDISHAQPNYSAALKMDLKYKTKTKPEKMPSCSGP